MAKSTKTNTKKAAAKKVAKPSNNESPTKEITAVTADQSKTTSQPDTQANESTTATTKEVVETSENKTIDPSHEVDQSGSLNGRSLDQVFVNEVPEDFPKHIFPPVVIPYLKSAAKGDELKMALRVWAKNYPGAIIVIGDKEDYFSDEVIHIPHTPESTNPQQDVTQKLLLLLASGAAGSTFILSNDDIYPLSPVLQEDLQTLKAFGSLEASLKFHNGLYGENIQRTIDALKKEKLPTHRYGTHTPMLIDADSLAYVIDKYKADQDGYLLTSLYFNEVYAEYRPIQVTGGLHDPILVSVYRDNVDPEALDKYLSTRKFVNVNNKGWASVEKILKKQYPDKSKYEK